MKAAGHGVFQMTSNHVGMEGELWWLTQVAKDNNLPVAFALVQTDQTPDTWKRLLAHLDETHAQGVPLYGSISGRATSMVMGFEGSLHPFVLTRCGSRSRRCRGNRSWRGCATRRCAPR
jgi:N-acyl-D-amino-acid deacylase